MAESRIHWIKGTILPAESGEYYVINRAMREIADPMTGENFYRAGEYEVTGDWWDAESGEWQTLGKDNPYWKVEAWAEIPKPPVPPEIAANMRSYFGWRLRE